VVGRDLHGGGAHASGELRSASGGIVWSPSATRNQDGSALQAGTPITSPRALQCNGCWTANMTLALTGSTSAAKWLTKSSSGSQAKRCWSMSRCARALEVRERLPDLAARLAVADERRLPEQVVDPQAESEPRPGDEPLEDEQSLLTDHGLYLRTDGRWRKPEPTPMVALQISRTLSGWPLQPRLA
jgi:hypothetical protein